MGRAVAVLGAIGMLAAGCVRGGASGPGVAGRKLVVVAAEDFWGSLAAEIGGDHVSVTSIIDRPSLDPHDYEPTTADARTVAGAGVVIQNGIGYDPWMLRLLDANPVAGRAVVDVGAVVSVPAGGNPHQWYSPDSVRRVIDAVESAYERLDPANRTAYQAGRRRLLTDGLGPYFSLIARIERLYGGTKVGASESIFAELAPALGLDLITPSGFLRAVSEGTEPAAADKAEADRQIRDHAIAIYAFNSQNATPDVQRQLEACRKQGIPVAEITETLHPAGATFQAWQTAQLVAIAAALHRATGR